jgi:hypothetical protein
MFGEKAAAKIQPGSIFFFSYEIRKIFFPSRHLLTARKYFPRLGEKPLDEVSPLGV